MKAAVCLLAICALCAADPAVADTHGKKIAFSNNYAGNSWRQAMLKSYGIVAKKAVALGVLKPEDATLQSYVTDKTLDGLFLMMAEEERAIRKDPLGQASSLLKKVFGAVR